MGQPKAFLRFGPGGSTLVEHVSSRAHAAGASNVVIVVGAAGASDDASLATQAKIEPLVKPKLGRTLSFAVGKPDGETIDSVRAGLSMIPRGHSVLLWPVDHPFADEELVQALVAALGGSLDCIAVPETGGRRGHPVLLGTAVAEELWSPALPEGARTVVLRNPGRLIRIDAVDRRIVDDLDTPGDAARLGIVLAERTAPI